MVPELFKKYIPEIL